MKHPQLGEVEVGGLDLLVGISNPPFEKLAEVCATQSAAFLRVAALVPRVTVEVVKQESIGPDHTKVELRIANAGYLATHGLPSAKKLAHSEPLRLSAKGSGLKIIAPAEGLIDIGHLDGWGTGLYSGMSIFAPWSRGSVHERFVTLVVEGRGRIQAKVGSCRVGYQTLEIAV